MKKTLNLLAFISLVTIVLTMLMILLGAIVKNTGSSLACPDWPLCFGQIMPEMKGAVAIEHSHRLLGTLLGILSILLLGISFFKKVNKKIIFSALGLLLLVIFQGVLGGITVLKKISPLFSTFHLATSQLFFAALIFFFFLILFQKKAQLKVPAHFKTPPATLWSISLWVLFLQIVIGAAIRHNNLGPACGLGWKYSLMCAELDVAARSFWPGNSPGKLHMFHRFFGVFTFIFIIFSSIPLMRWAKKHQLKGLKLSIISVHILLSLQILLGMQVIGSFISGLSISLHLIVAMILWGLLVGTNIWVRQYKVRQWLNS